MSKQSYLAPLVELTLVDSADVIATSGLGVSATDNEKGYGPLIPIKKN